MVDLKLFENLILIAKKHNVDSFSYEGMAVNLGKEIAEFPTYDPEEPDDMPPVPKESDDILLNNPMMR